MSLPRWPTVAAFLTGTLLCSTLAYAQDLALTKDSEFGFQRLIHFAQTGRLGDDIANANVGVLKDRVRIELIGRNGETRLLLLTRKTSTLALARYFDIEVGQGATASDAARVGKALDEAFEADPFEVALGAVGAYPGAQRVPSLAEAWRDGGARGVFRSLAWCVVTPPGLGYTLTVTVLLAIAALASLIVLWGSAP